MISALAVLAVGEIAWNPLRPALDPTLAGVAGTLLIHLLRRGERDHDARLADRETLRRNIEGAATDGQPPTVDDGMDPWRQIHPAEPLPGQPGAGSCLPAYVPRDADRRLDAAIRNGGLISIEGPRAHGLTRMAFEAVKRNCRSWSLVMPVSAKSSLPEIAAALSNMHNVVVYIDSLQEHAEQGGLSAHVLSTLCPPGRTDIVILATFTPMATVSGPLTAVRDRATVIDVAQDAGDSLVNTEGARAAARADPRIARALAQDGEPFPQYLASGPALVRWLQLGLNGSRPMGAAIVLGALHCRRLGVRVGLTRQRLYDLHRFYLKSQEDPLGLDDALAWATQPVLGTAACLQATGETYEPHPCLVEQAAQLGRTASPPGEFSDRLVAYLRQENRLTGYLRTSGLEGRLAAQEDDTEAACLLGHVLMEAGRADEALTVFLAAAGKGAGSAACHAGLLYLQRSDRGNAKSWLDFAATAGDTGALVRLAELIYADGRFSDEERGRAEILLRYAASKGDPAAAGLLGRLHRESGNIDGMLQAGKPAPPGPGRTAAGPGGTAAQRPCRHETDMRHGIAAGDPAMLNDFGVLMERQGAAPGASFDWFERAHQAGSQAAAENMTRARRPAPGGGGAGGSQSGEQGGPAPRASLGA